MGTTKKHFYTDDQLEIAEVFKALGHPARIKIIELFCKNESLSCNDLQFYIPLSQSTISNHLKELRNCGLIGYKIVGTKTVHFVNKDILLKIINYIQDKQVKIKNQSFRHTSIYFNKLLRYKNLPILVNRSFI